MYCVYALYSSTFNKIYIGYTADLPARLNSHNELATSGYTFRYRPWIVVHTEIFSLKKDAMLRERQLKSAKGREFIWAIVKNNKC